MDYPKKPNVSNESNFPQQIVLTVDPRSKLITAKETPTRQTNEPNTTPDKISSAALCRHPPQSVQSEGSHVTLLTRDQCENSKITNAPITDEPAEASVHSAATRKSATANRSEDFVDCRVSIRPSKDCVTNPDQSAALHAAASNQSAESVVCRICHLSATESNAPLDETGCECRGSLSLCHRRCVEHWMLVKMSKQCEICQRPFKYDIVIPEYQIQGQFSAATPVDGSGPMTACQDSRRLLFFVIYILLLFTAGTSTTLSIFSREEHMKRKPVNVTMASIELTARNERMYAYGVSLAVTIFVGFHMVAVGVLWVVAETIVLPRERILRQHIEIFRNIYAAQLQESSYIWRNGGNAESGTGGGGGSGGGGGGLGGQTATGGNIRVTPMSGQIARNDGSGQVRRPPTPRYRDQRRIPEIIVQAGNQLALPFRRQGFSRPAPPPVMRRLADGHRGPAAGGCRHQVPRPFDQVTRPDHLDRNTPHESPVRQTHPGFMEILAAQMGMGSTVENNQTMEAAAQGNTQRKGEDEIGASQNPAKCLAEGDQGDQDKPYNIEMQDLSDEASKSEAAACCTSHIIGKQQSANSSEKK